MSIFPPTPQKIRARIRSYERSMRKEQEEFDSINDGYGKRYLLGALYLKLGDSAILRISECGFRIKEFTHT